MLRWRDQLVAFLPGWYWIRRTDATVETTRVVHMPNSRVWDDVYSANHQIAGPIPEPLPEID